MNNNFNESFLSVVSITDLFRNSPIKNKRYYDNAQSRHRLIMALFSEFNTETPRQDKKILFRIETLFSNGKYSQRALIRSAVKPEASLISLKTIKEDFNFINNGDQIAFRVTASPMKRKTVSTPTNKNNKIEYFLKEQEEQENWLVEKLADIIEIKEIIDIISESVPRQFKKKDFIQLTQYDVIGEVKNINNLNQILESGLGRNKSYGAGLLTIKKI